MGTATKAINHQLLRFHVTLHLKMSNQYRTQYPNLTAPPPPSNPPVQQQTQQFAAAIVPQQQQQSIGTSSGSVANPQFQGIQQSANVQPQYVQAPIPVQYVVLSGGMNGMVGGGMGSNGGTFQNNNNGNGGNGQWKKEDRRQQKGQFFQQRRQDRRPQLPAKQPEVPAAKSPAQRQVEILEMIHQELQLLRQQLKIVPLTRAIGEPPAKKMKEDEKTSKDEKKEEKKESKKKEEGKAKAGTSKAGKATAEEQQKSDE